VFSRGCLSTEAWPRAAAQLALSACRLGGDCRSRACHSGVRLLDRSARGRPTMYGCACSNESIAVFDELKQSAGTFRALGRPTTGEEGPDVPVGRARAHRPDEPCHRDDDGAGGRPRRRRAEGGGSPAPLQRVGPDQASARPTAAAQPTPRDCGGEGRFERDGEGEATPREQAVRTRTRGPASGDPSRAPRARRSDGERPAGEQPSPA